MQKNVKKTELNQTAWWKRALCCVQDNVRGQNILVIVPGARRKKNRTKLCLFGMLRIEPSAVKPPCFFNQIEEENDTH